MSLSGVIFTRAAPACHDPASAAWTEPLTSNKIITRADRRQGQFARNRVQFIAVSQMESSVVGRAHCTARPRETPCGTTGNGINSMC